MSWSWGWRPYVPVAQRRAKAAAYAARLAKKENRALCPVQLPGRKITTTFWGQAWCDNLERYSDFANRLPRGRTYVRNGSVIDLQIENGRIKAIVSGSEIYHVTIQISTLPRALWKAIQQDCAQSIDSLMDLLQGRFDEGVMARLTQKEGGLFPRPNEIKMTCSCPDWAGLCKHVAAVLYGAGARMDSDPEMLFKLRNVDHLELVGTAVAAENLDRTLSSGSGKVLAGDLGEIFGIELEAGEPAQRRPVRARRAAGAVKSAAVAQDSSPSVGGSPGRAGKPAKAKKSTRDKPTGRSDAAKGKGTAKGKRGGKTTV
jgi:hypothetical protein